MRIAVVSPHFPTRALPFRGATHDEQMRRFARAGHDVRAVVPLPWGRRRADGARVPAEERDGDLVIAHPRHPAVPRLPRGLRWALERRLFARAAAEGLRAWGADPDVVLAHSATLPGGLLGRVGGAAFVVSLYDHELFQTAPRSRRIHAGIADTLRRADCAVYLSEALRREGLEIAGPHRAEVIPLGIATLVEPPPAPPRELTICTVGSLVRRKRADLVVRAFARIAAERPEARLVIVGEGPEREALVRLVGALGVADRVEMTGLLDARGAQERIARASVMALPSVRESLGAVYLEAMALGVPALGTQGEGIAEHVEHGVTGILVPPDDEDALVAELRALADDPERARRIGEAGRRRFEAGPFSWSSNARAFLRLFEELLEARRAAARGLSARGPAAPPGPASP